MRGLTNTNIYTALCVFGPILYMYKSPVPGIDLGTFFVLLFAVLLFFSAQKSYFRMHWTLGLVILYTVFNTVISLGVGATYYYSSMHTIIMRTLRFCIVMVVMIGVGYTSFFDFKKYISLLNVVSVLIAGYAIVQSIVFRLTGIKLLNVVKGGEFSSTLGEYESFYRPPSVFYEPSHVLYYLTPIERRSFQSLL